MKKIIITKSQLNEIMDSKKSLVTFNGNNATELGVNAQEKYNDALRGGFNSNAITLQGKTEKNNATDKDETIVSVDTTKPSIKDAVSQAFSDAVHNGADPNKITVQGNAEDIKNGTNEAKVYTKRDVEIARLYEMRRNGKVLTKQQLKEEILGETEDIGEFIRNKNVFDVLEAVGEVFGQDVLQSLSTSWDMSAKIVEIYNNADDAQKEEFKRRIEGDTSDDNDDENLIDLDLDIPDMDVFKN